MREEEAAGRMQSLSLWVVGSIPAVAFFFFLIEFFSLFILLFFAASSLNFEARGTQILISKVLRNLANGIKEAAITVSRSAPPLLLQLLYLPSCRVDLRSHDAPLLKHHGGSQQPGGGFELDQDVYECQRPIHYSC